MPNQDRVTSVDDEPGPAADRLLRRARLEELLDVAVAPASTTRLAMVCAGPGFGKTTLVRSWSEATALPVAYVSFHGVDPVPGLFWRLLLDGIAQAGGAAADAVAGLRAPRVSQPDFVVEVTDALASCDLVIVLDDLHAIVDRRTLTELEHLLRRLPASVRPVLVSRSEPPLPVVQDLQMAGLLLQVRARSLAFTFDEVSAICADLDERQRQLVMAETEGWPAMVRLMRIALREGLEVAELWDRETALVDHLFAEVFNRRSPAEQDVLLVSALTDPAPLALVVELSGHAGAGVTLDRTARQSGLITKHTGDGEVGYHLHPILRAFLTGELLRRDLKNARVAHAAAARWFLDRGAGLRALDHALLSDDADTVEEVLSREGIALVNEGASARLVSVLAASPARVRGQWEDVVSAAALVDLGRVAEATAHLERGAAQTLPEGLQALRSAVRCHAQRREGLVPDDSLLVAPPAHQLPDVQLYCALHRGVHHLRQGRLAQAETDLALAVRLAEGLGRPAALVDALTMQAEVSSARSDFHELSARSRRAVETAERSGWGRSTRAAFLHLLAGWSARQSLDDVRARHHASAAMDLVDPSDEPTVVLAVHALQAATAYQTAGGEPADAHRLHELWRMGAGRFLSPELVVYAATVDAHFSLALGRPDRLHRISEDVLRRLGDTADHRLLAALHQLASGRREPALRTLREALQAPAVVPLTHVEVLAVSARLRLQGGDEFATRQLLDDALERAAHLGGIRPLVDAGGPVVIAFLRAHQGSWRHHEQLVARLVGHTTEVKGPAVALTDRELAVLHQLPTMSTMDEIATTMVVSVNTVKTHLRNVYRKLGVTSRRDAVAEARRCGIL